MNNKGNYCTVRLEVQNYMLICQTYEKTVKLTKGSANIEDIYVAI